MDLNMSASRPIEGRIYIVNGIKLVLINDVRVAIIPMNWIAFGNEVYTNKEVHLNGKEHKLKLVPNIGEVYTYMRSEIRIDEVTLSNSEMVHWRASATNISTGKTLSIDSTSILMSTDSNT